MPEGRFHQERKLVVRRWIFTLSDVDPSTYAHLKLEGGLDKACLAS
jgi:hypothetical protein